jgi:PPM family protein phosphatase
VPSASLGSDAALEGAGTTLTALAWSGSELALVHIGDSRAYLLRDGELLQLTHDDTLVQSLIELAELVHRAGAPDNVVFVVADVLAA